MSEASPRFFSTEYKVSLVARLERGEPAARLARESGVARKLLYDWLKAYRAHGPAGLNRKRGRKVGWRPPPSAFPASSVPASADAGPSAAGSAEELAKAVARIAELERIIGRQQADLHFFREALRLWDATSRSGGAPTSTRSSKK
ncbi:MAG: helix-turn-helix domain-containing protein [Hyphomicrobiales bacterium]|nr:helix-turn-helix domain-containing protein [Hyphomicrobiales bacterium]